MELRTLLELAAKPAASALVAIAIEFLRSRISNRTSEQRRAHRRKEIAVELESLRAWSAVAERLGTVETAHWEHMRSQFATLTKDLIGTFREPPPRGAGPVRRALLLDVPWSPLTTALRILYYVTVLVLPWRLYENIKITAWADPVDVLWTAGAIVVAIVPAVALHLFVRRLASGPPPRDPSPQGPSYGT